MEIGVSGTNIHNPLPLKLVTGDLALARPTSPPAPDVVTSGDAALSLMTDFTAIQPVVVRDTVPIGEALEFMKRSGVRLLFVQDSEQHLLGYITSYDIQGEKPLRYLQSMDCTHAACTCSWEQILVRDIMVPASAWLVLDFRAVERARIGDIVVTFKAAGRRHLVVVERTPDGSGSIVRGLFSASQLELHLGLTIETLCPAATFAQIERVIAHDHEECD